MKMIIAAMMLSLSASRALAQEAYYVQRDAHGNVTGIFANEQTYAHELLPKDHHDISAFRDRREDARKPKSAAWYLYQFIRRAISSNKP